MKIVFSIYLEDGETGRVFLKYSDVVETDLSIKQIDERLQLYDLFHSELTVGHTLSFWDIYFWGNIPNDIIDKVKSIPEVHSYRETYREPCFLRVGEFDPGNTDSAIYPDIGDCYFYRISRYERGASGFGTFIAKGIASPIMISLVSSFIYDILRSLFKRKNREIDSKRALYLLNVRKFWNNFCKATNLDKFSCQMVFLTRIDDGKYEIHVRNIQQECYQVVCDNRGRIESLKLIEICSNGCE